MGKEVVILVDFPPEVVLKYRTLIEEYVPSTPIRTDEANLQFTKNQAYHVVAILFFLHSQLPLKYPQLKNALHAGWMSTFKHPMNFEELRRPPCVGDGAYTEEEQQ